ncbi:hypothetical protein JAAARDRAFT_211284 [Jaapia argillacea MUCL 33604]|uniref:Dienelactone hydrolase domain-containing protein n=1 Tax=Jaapia argillacea MUCL 33604 TaxID=933084 RepID=A0A067PL03_9AGAM|nr:hypothetical protein JAAARDRAFT_211284 [Jaapia argillacea MUCL 33604]
MSTNKVLASPPANCCVTGVKHSGTPQGYTIPLGGMETYVSEPKNGVEGVKRVILYLSDIWGSLFLNSKLIQDYFAARGYIVLGPDYFFGNPPGLRLDDPAFDFDQGMKTALDKATEVLPAWYKAVKEKYGTDVKYFAVGYCFGAPHTLKLASSDEIVAAAIAHPAFLTEDDFRGIKSEHLSMASSLVPLADLPPSNLQNLSFSLVLVSSPRTRPSSTSLRTLNDPNLAEDDFLFPTPSRRIAEDILFGKKATYQLEVYSGVGHGFAVRGDPEVEHERWAKEESAKGIVGWFDRFSK